VDADGLLSVTAREQATGVESSIAVKPSYGLSDEDVTRMLRDAYTHAKDDMFARALNEQRVDGTSLIEATRHALAEDGATLLNQDERTLIDAQISELNATMAGDDHLAIKRAVEALNLATTEFAQRRMDMNVRRALAGHKLEEIG
jgi:molecular chaperone HscA